MFFSIDQYCSKTLEIGMDKKEALEILKNHIDLSDEKNERENFWIRNNNQIIGSIGFTDQKLSLLPLTGTMN